MQATLFAALALLLVLAVHISVVDAFAPHCVSFKTNAITATKPSSPSRLQQAAGPGGPGPTLDDRTRERLDQLVKNNKVLLFMKGNKIFPQWLAAPISLLPLPSFLSSPLFFPFIPSTLQWVQQHRVPHFGRVEHAVRDGQRAGGRSDPFRRQGLLVVAHHPPAVRSPFCVCVCVCVFLHPLTPHSTSSLPSF
jgi:hypothetical protein